MSTHMGIVSVISLSVFYTAYDSIVLVAYHGAQQ